MFKYAKAIAAALGAAGVTVAAFADGTVDNAELAAIIAAWSGVVGVYSARNTTPAQ